MTTELEEPELVTRARARAEELGFSISSEPGVGALLAVLTAATPEGARIIELGTGAGVGLAWIVHGLGERDDATVITVDIDAPQVAVVESAGWPAYLEFVSGDEARVVRTRAPFDLIFADAPGGKTEGLEGTIAALAPGGLLVVDDMDPALHGDDGFLELLVSVRETIVRHPMLVAVELPCSSGIIVAAKRSNG